MKSVSPSAAAARARATLQPPLKIVGIGASAGGLEAFTELLRNLPSEADLAYVLVQHLDPTHRSLLSELLAKATTLPVEEITANTHVEKNRIYVIPPNCDLAIQKGVLKLTPRKKNGGPARSIDNFLQSLAADQRQNAIGVILSGAGSDGARGLRAIKEAGGMTFAQDAGTSKYDSMPRSAVATGCVDFVLSPAKIAQELSRLLADSGDAGPRKRRAAANARQRRGAVSRNPARFSPPSRKPIAWPSAPEDVNLRKIFLLLRTRTGTDFSLYRITTIRRRLARRMSLLKIKDLEAYARHLREHVDELEALYQDFLINVTSFFRNPTVFEKLKRKIFPRLTKNAPAGEPLRIWVAGCSTGQEAYSIAMAYTEFAEQTGNAQPVQIFATDVNSSVLEIARAARFTENQVNSVNATRLQRFFSPENGGYRVVKAIRDMVIFAQQDLLVDPPFTRVDLITCRNMMIYLEPALQQRIIPAFHYALRPNGVLLLGTSESIGTFTSLFEPIEQGQKIYLKKAAANWLRLERPPVVPVTKALRMADTVNRSREFQPTDALREADRMTLAKYAPVSVVVSEEGEILQFRGDAQRYLDLPTGKASFQLLKMAREGLALPLQRAFLRAQRENRVVREKGIRFDGRRGLVNIEIVPLKNLKARCFLVLFEKVAAAARVPGAPASRSSPANGKHDAADGRELSSLRQDYVEAREHLANLQEEHDTSVEELQASNEEVQSANEELQSLNEELETSNEELESANEELTTLNEELATRNAELRESEQRLREQAQLLELAPVIARSPKNRIIFWNQGAEKLYGFSKEEAMGQTTHLFLNAQYPEPIEKIEKELHRRGQWSGEVLHRRKDGQVICVATQWVLHHDNNRKVRAILEVNTDVTGRRAAEQALRQSEALNRSILESSPDCIQVLDLAGRLVFMNQGGEELLERDFKKVANAYWPMLWDGEARAAAEKAYHTALAGETARFREFAATPKGKPKWWDVVVRPILSVDGRPEKLLVVSRDVTTHRLAEIAALEDARWSRFQAEVALAVIPVNDVSAVCQELAETIARHFEASFAGIFTLNGAQVVELRGSAGEHVAPPGTKGPIDLKSPALVRLIQAGEVVATNEAATECKICDPAWARREAIHGFIALPIQFENRAAGAIVVLCRHDIEPRARDEFELAANALVQFMTRKADEAERVRLLHESLEARAEVELLNEIGRRIAAELDLQKLAQAVTEAATKLARAEFGSFCYYRDELAGTRGLCTFAGSGAIIPENFTQSLWSDGERQPVRLDDVTTDPRFRSNDDPRALPQGRHPLRSYLAIPVAVRSGEIIGGLFFGHSRPGMFTERDERVVVNLAAQAATAMENARLVDQLERKVTERTARLQETISELQAFSYTVSHDLRAPLRAMQSYAQVLLQDCGKELSESARDYLSRIEKAGIRLDRLIQDVLTYGRIARAQVTVQPLNLEKLLSDLMQQYPMLQPPAAEIQIKGPLPPVLAEESSITQCLSNLLGNAVKFVPKGRKPVVTVRAEKRDQRIRLWIEDNGIGIAPQDQERIFKMFERVDGARDYEGTGIGLAIVRKAAERMGGAVGVESHPTAGSRFWLDFNSPSL